MRTIAYDEVVQRVAALCIAAAYELPADVWTALETALDRESEPRPRRILQALLDNARIAAEERIPICQDTGLAVVFVKLGAEVRIAPPADRPDATLADAIHEGVARGYEEGLLRKSVVADPLGGRANTGTNSPAVIHVSIVPGDRLRLTVMTKGGGCENKSRFRMFNPTEDRRTVAGWIVRAVAEAGADACPPFVVGVGIGGDFEQCCLLSKKALLRSLGSRHGEPLYAEMEAELLEAINALDVGPQGLGGRTTALAVQIETAPCHIASLPVAVNIECHAHRHQTAEL